MASVFVERASVDGGPAPERGTGPGTALKGTGAVEGGWSADPASALHAQLTGAAEQFGVGTRALAQALADLSQLVGLLILELGGHFVGSADPADHLWQTVIEDQSRRARRRER